MAHPQASQLQVSKSKETSDADCRNQAAKTTTSVTPILVSATFEYKDGRIWFVKSPYSLKDEIKAMRGSKWHGYEEENPRKIWSVEDCQRNRFQFSFLLGEDRVVNLCLKEKWDVVRCDSYSVAGSQGQISALAFKPAGDFVSGHRIDDDGGQMAVVL